MFTIFTKTKYSICRRTLALLLALCAFLPLLPAKKANASGAYSYVRVKLGSGAFSSFSINVTGTYFIQDNGIEFSGGTLSVSSSGGSMIVSHSALGNIYTGSRCNIKRANMDRNAGFLYFNGKKYLGHFNLRLSSSGYIQIVNELPMAQYLYGVVGYEMSEQTFPIEALKAQAIAAKGYVINQLGSYAEYDIGDTSADQVYKGYNSTYTKVINAVDSTLNMVLVSGGSIVCTYFAASNGGETNLPSYAWPTKNRSNLGYAIVQDPYDLANVYSPKEVVKIPVNTNGSISSPLYQLILTKAGAALGTSATAIDNISAVSLSGEANPGTTRNMTQCAISATVRDASGMSVPVSFSFRLSELYSFGAVSNGSLRSYWGEQIGNEFCIYHLRYGHGVGLSQRGAQQRANEGQSYEQILAFYYPQASLSYTNDIQPPENPVNSLAGTTVPTGPSVPLPSPTPVPGTQNPSASAGIIAYGRINYDDTNYRSGPSTGYPSYGKLDTGALLDIYGESGSWYHVGVGGHDAFVYKRYVDITGTPAAGSAPTVPTVLPTAAPLATPAPAVQSQPVPIAVGTVTKKNVNFRSGASTSSKSLGKFHKGDVVQVYSKQGNWLYVSIQSVFGYVSSQYVKLNTSAALPSPSPTPTEAPKIPANYGETVKKTYFYEKPSTSSKKTATLSKGAKLVLYELKNGWFEAVYNMKHGYISAEYVMVGTPLDTSYTVSSSPAPTTVPLASGSAAVIPSAGRVTPASALTSAEVNFRTLPDASAGAIIEKLPKRAYVQLLGRCGEWYYIFYNNNTGYVSGSYLQISAQGSFAPFEVPSGTRAYNTTTNGEVNMRVGPSTANALIRTLPKNSSVTVLLKSGAWCLVLQSGEYGFLSADYLR